MMLTDEEIYEIWPSEVYAFSVEAKDFARAIEVKVLEKLKEQEPVAYYTCQGNWPRIVLAIDGNSDGYETPLYALEKK